MFDEFSLPSFILEAIAKQGWDKPTPIQALVLPKALEGADILGGAPTGTGKSAAFILPILTRLASRPRTGIQAVILEPTRELAIQTMQVAQDLLALQTEAIESGEGEIHESISVGTIIGGEDRVKQRESLPNIVCATPGRLLEFLQKSWLDASTVEILVIDEADRMLDMGFKEDMSYIVEALSKCHQTMLFSATLEGFGVREFASKVLVNAVEIKVGSTEGDGESIERLPELLQSRAYYAANEEQKFKILSHLLTTVRGKSIVFVRTKDHLSSLASALKRKGTSFASLKGECSQIERRAALRRFSDGEVQLLIATDVASRGLDLEDVEYVYNFDLPHKGDTYVHRAGRTARAGNKGVVISFVLPEEIAILERLERYCEREIERRAIKGLCAAFDSVGVSKPSEKKRGRASPNGGFDKKSKSKDAQAKKPHKKVRLRDKKNKGKPDFAQKRAKKEARLAAKNTVDTTKSPASETSAKS